MPKCFTSHDEVLRRRWFLLRPYFLYALITLYSICDVTNCACGLRLLESGFPTKNFTALNIKTTYGFRRRQDIQTCQPPCWPAANSPLKCPITSWADTCFRFLSDAHTSLSGPSLAPKASQKQKTPFSKLQHWSVPLYQLSLAHKQLAPVVVFRQPPVFLHPSAKLSALVLCSEKNKTQHQFWSSGRVVVDSTVLEQVTLWNIVQQICPYWTFLVLY